MDFYLLRESYDCELCVSEVWVNPKEYAVLFCEVAETRHAAEETLVEFWDLSMR